jgi:hypothetical protein
MFVNAYSYFYILSWLCANCHEKHPANYRGCIIHKQLQQKKYPTLRDRNIPQPATPSAQAGPIQTGITYAQGTQHTNAQVTQGQHSRPQPNVETPPSANMEQPSNDLQELKHVMTNPVNQMNTLINLISALVTKTK